MEARGAAPGKTSRHKILIVDDEWKICNVLVQYFARKGYEVRAASRGDEALTLAGIFQPDVVVLDLLMPGMSGIETLKRFKQLKRAPRVVVLSVADPKDVAEGALQLGAESYVCKPADLSQLESVIRDFWSPAEQRKQANEERFG